MTGISTQDRESWRTATPATIACGCCDRKPAGSGARTVMDPKRGLIVACSVCVVQLEREASRARAREKERAR